MIDIEFKNMNTLRVNGQSTNERENTKLNKTKNSFLKIRTTIENEKK